MELYFEAIGSIGGFMEQEEIQNNQGINELKSNQINSDQAEYTAAYQDEYLRNQVKI